MSMVLKNLGDIEFFSITRNQYYEFVFTAYNKLTYEVVRGEEQREKACEKFNSENKDYTILTLTFYEFNFKFNDNTFQTFSVTGSQLEDFYKKRILTPNIDFRDQVFYMYDSIYCLTLNPGLSQLKTVQIEIPLELVKEEINYLNSLPLPKTGTITTSVKEITDVVINFWKPSVMFNWGSGAYELYSENKNKSALNNRTLSDLVDSLHTMARNYSRNQNNPSYLNVFKDSDNDFVWSIQNTDKQVVFNGGIIFHRDYDNEAKLTENGHYSIHT